MNKTGGNATVLTISFLCLPKPLSTMPVSKSVAMSKSNAVTNKNLYFDDLEIGASGSFIAMLCRAWDVNAATGRYLSRDFVLCDAKGKTMHGTCRTTVAHMFLRLKEGEVYNVKNFSVQPNREEYRIYKDAPFILEFDEATIVRKVNVPLDGFVRYPLQLVELDHLELTYNKFMIDVVGYVTNVGRSVQQRSGSKTLDFYLANSSGHSVRVTLWGALGDQLIERRTRCKGMYPVVLTAVSVKIYNNRTYLSSTSSTMIMDDASIPALKSFMPTESAEEKAREVLPLEFAEPKAGTLENLLMWSRNRKNDAATFYCEVRIDGIRTKRGWSFPSCPGEKCRKQASRSNGEFWCESCLGPVEYPVMRYRLELEVSDNTAAVVVVMFDEVATKLVKYSADSIMQAVEQDEISDSPLPTALANIVGTSLSLELTAQSYFEHADYESFTCWNIVCPTSGDETGGLRGVKPSPAAHSGLALKTHDNPSIITPVKNTESKNRPRVDLEDSYTECSAAAGAGTGTSIGGASSKRRKRYVVEDSELD